MAEVGTLRFPMSKAVGQLTLNVRITGQQAFKVRAWLGIKLLQLAAMVIGTKLEVTLGGAPKDNFQPSLDMPPLHLSMDEVERGEPVTFREAARIKVMVDGVVSRDVLAYDVEDGWLERYRRDPQGELVITGGELEVEHVTGLVTAEYRKDAA